MRSFFFAKVNIFIFRTKTMVHGVFFWSPEKVLRKVYQLKGNEKRNLLVLV